MASPVWSRKSDCEGFLELHLSRSIASRNILKQVPPAQLKAGDTVTGTEEQAIHEGTEKLHQVSTTSEVSPAGVAASTAVGATTWHRSQDLILAQTGNALLHERLDQLSTKVVRPSPLHQTPPSTAYTHRAFNSPSLEVLTCISMPGSSLDL